MALQTVSPEILEGSEGFSNDLQKGESRGFPHISTTKMGHLTVSEPTGRKMEGLTGQVDGSIQKPIQCEVREGEFT